MNELFSKVVILYNLAGSNLAGSNLAGSNLAGSNLAGWYPGRQPCRLPDDLFLVFDQISYSKSLILHELVRVVVILYNLAGSNLAGWYPADNLAG
ncbi:MAG TPA: hypothetical protein VFU15_11180 [Bacteroidia bacterium]|nr:hypothetical protein [Bacteroidia bacterium]